MNRVFLLTCESSQYDNNLIESAIFFMQPREATSPRVKVHLLN